MRTAARRDDNERDIVIALENAGCVVVKLSDPDLPDLMVCRPRVHDVVLLEVKQPGKSLRPGQQLFFDSWPGARHVVRSVDDALAAVQLTRFGRPA